MTANHLSFLAACVALASTPAFAQRVVINEFSYDDSGTDDREFVELYNADTVPVDISNWRLVAADEAGPTANNNADYTIPAGTILQPGQFWVLGAGGVPNVNQVVGVQDLWENSHESLELRDPTGRLIDAVVYEAYAYPANSGVWAADVPAEIGDGIWSTFTSIDSFDCSWSRIRDGHDTNNNGRDFRQIRSTPGASNDVAPVLPVVEFFDGFTHNQGVPGWSNSFVPFTAVDPQNQSPPLPMLIPVSPQGGNAAIMWDPTGGGNYATLDTEVVENVVFEAWVYFDANPEPAGEYESWTIGIQGTADSYGNTPGFPGNPTATFNAYGGTGIAAIYQNDEFGGILRLVDVNDGGWGATATTPERILGEITLTAGVNDGWQRLRLHAGNGFAELRFGGNHSALDGTVLSGRTTMGSPGGIYLTYREFLTNNGDADPPIVDFLIVRDGIADVEFRYAGTPNSVGTPILEPNSMPTLGNAGFGYAMSDLAANSASVLLLGFAELATPLDLSLIGAPAGTFSYVDAVSSLTVTADGQGNASLALQVPADPALSGGALLAQLLNVDVGIPASLPVASSEVVVLTLGN